MARSMRTAFIRIHSENNTQNGNISYTDSDVENMIKTTDAWSGTTWWFIKHKADEEVSQNHWHVVFKFKNPVPFESIKTLFPYGDIENAKSIKNCVQYLVHANDESKVQYRWEDVKTNCKDMTPYKIKSDSQNEVTIQKIMEQIDKGEIREYNQFTSIPIELWSKYKTRIENALTYYRERVCMQKDREISVVFMSGATGVGKTTFAKQYCEGSGKSCCISSSSNDPMQDYKGEDVLILDDMRDDSYSFTDLLKILDNHTKSTVKSRYHNKAFIGDMIIITSYRPITDWYFNVEKEAKEQLYRRVKTWYKFDKEKIDIFAYEEEKNKYIRQGSIKNIITMKRKEQAQVALDMVKAMGLEFEPETQKKIDEFMEKTDEEWEQLEMSEDVENPFKF